MNAEEQNNLIGFLSRLPACAGFSAAMLAKLVQAGRLLKFQRGQTLIAGDQVPDQIFLLVQGKARLLSISANSDNHPFSLGFSEPGKLWLGYFSAKCSRPLERAIATEEGALFAVPNSAFFEVLASVSEIPEGARRISPCFVFHILHDWAGMETRPQAARELARHIETWVCDVEFQTTLPSPAAETSKTWLAIGTDGKVFNPHAGSGPHAEPTSEFFGWDSTRLQALQAPDTKTPETPPADTTAGTAPLDAGAPTGTASNLQAGDSNGGSMRQAAPGIEACIASLEWAAGHFQRPFLKDPVLRVLQQKKDIPLDLFVIGSVCEMTGLHAQLISVSTNKLFLVETPCLFLLNGQPAILASADGASCTVHSPIEGTRTILRADWEKEMGEVTQLLALRPAASGKEKKFSLRWFLPALQKHRRVLIEIFIASFFVQLFALGNPIITQVIIDKVLVQNSLQTLNALGLLLIVVAVASAVTTALRTYLFADTTNRLDFALGTKVIDHLYRLTLGYFGRRPVGEVTNRLYEMENIRQFLTGTALTVVLDGLFSVIYIGIMLFYNVTLTIVALAAVPVMGFITFVIAPIFREQIRRRARSHAATQSYVVETLTGVQTIKAQNLEQKVRWDWQERYARYIADNFRSVVTTTTASSATSLLSKLSDLGVLWFGAYLVIEGKLTLGQLIAFRIIAGYVTNPLLRLIQSWQSFQEVGLAVERLGDVLDSKTEQEPEQINNIPMPEIHGAIDYQNVTFRYLPDRPPQLLNVSITIPPGSFVGVVGQSGSGKSTLLKLLARMYPPESGRVLIDGYDISKVELYSLRRQIGTVLQDAMLFDATVQENIRIAQPDAPVERVLHAARVACAHDFIMELPEGYNTRVGEQGRALSGGQRQRIAVARAVLQSPRILALDEATSALDFPTEARLLDNLLREFQGRTVFFITHRLRSLSKADSIFVMDNGAIVESGVFQELLNRRGVFYHLARQQQEAA